MPDSGYRGNPPETECCGVNALDPCEPWCVNANAPDRWDLGDRYIEAVLGARLRFHATTDDLRTGGEARAAYWRAVYDRWAELYRGHRGPRVAGGYAYER